MPSRNQLRMFVCLHAEGGLLLVSPHLVVIVFRSRYQNRTTEMQTYLGRLKPHTDVSIKWGALLPVKDREEKVSIWMQYFTKVSSFFSFFYLPWLLSVFVFFFFFFLRCLYRLIAYIQLLHIQLYTKETMCWASSATARPKICLTQIFSS